MQSTRIKAVRSLQHGSRRIKLDPQRRFAHDESHGASAHASPTADEPLGLGFYFLLSLIPGLYLTYQFSRPNDDGSPNPIIRLATKYSDWSEVWKERNARHTQLIEQAGHDRSLFTNTRQSNVAELRFPEVFNSCSPVNVPAGGGSINLDKVVAHYRKQHLEEEEAKLQRMKEGKIPGQKPWEEIPPGKR